MCDFEFLTVATPKQIRELMKVDGLTNDEVKSHLQVNVFLFTLHVCSDRQAPFLLLYYYCHLSPDVPFCIPKRTFCSLLSSFFFLTN